MKSYRVLRVVIIPAYFWWTTIHISNQHNAAHQRKSESNKQNFPETFLRGIELRRQDLGATNVYHDIGKKERAVNWVLYLVSFYD